MATIYQHRWAAGCGGPAIPTGTLRELKRALDEIYGYDVGPIDGGYGGPEDAQAPEWELVEVA